MSDELGTPLAEIVGMKKWDDTKKRWMGVVCQTFRAADGKERIHVYDAMWAPHEDQLSEMLNHSIATKPWQGRHQRAQ